MPERKPAPDARPPGEGPFDREIGVRGIVGFSIGLAVVIVLSGVAMWVMFRAFEAEERQRESPPSPLLAEGEAPPPPEPRLQTTPEQDLAAMRAEEQALLHSYGWIDESAGIARIPLERSMQLLLQKGVPTRPEPRPWLPPGTWRDPSLQRLKMSEVP
ncbi:MAG: hypothetical protein JSW67_01620 [Candidatus Latescibacterota bacterium]|nr:MAG: hypothetical protein JSW67_01620 [Candidatus Latescibacterota bacterium]